jgi:hypothetical protein
MDVRLKVGPKAYSVATPTPTGPLAAPAGTNATSCVSLQLFTVAATPGKKTTELLLCVGPKPVPVIVSVLPTGPELVESPVTVRGSRTVNCTPLLVTPSSNTVTGPLVAFEATATVILELLHESTVAETPFNCTWLLLWFAPKPEPLRVIVLLG